MANDMIDATAEVAPVSLDDRVALIRMENDTFFAAAKAQPRDHKSIRDDLVAQLDAYPQLAAECIYSKPVGKDKDSGEMKYATGLSVRCAEALADIYGYNRVEAETLELDADRVKIVATFTDFARVRVWRTSGILSKTYKDRYGKLQRHQDDRFYGIVCKAEASRLIREAIVRAVPPGLRAQLREMCERKMAGLLSDKGVQRIIDKYEEIGVKAETLEKHLNKKTSKWTDSDRVTLGKLFNGIEQGDTSIEEVFGGEIEPVGGDKKQRTVPIDDLDNPERVDESAETTETAPKSKRTKAAEKPAAKADSPKPAEGTTRTSKVLTKEVIQSEIKGCTTEDQLTSNYKYFAKRIDSDLMDWLNSICSEQSEVIRGVDGSSRE